MLHNIITYKKDQWLQSDNCTITALMTYIREHGHIREPQIQAIETYLFLKIEGENKPLWQLFAEGFFTSDIDIDKALISTEARLFLKENPSALSLYDFANTKINGETLLPELVTLIASKPTTLDYETIIKRIFYNVSYADYLLSLPMGAGKTYLMAAFIYLDLYFAQLEPDNPHFAHNFLVLIPSGLKTSIVPSLRTIQNFDPSWIIPEPSATELKRLLKFEILDEQKSAKKSNKARNPNAQKVNLCLPNPFGQVFVVNAEKVILDRLEVSAQLDLIEKTEEEADKAANELRNLIGKIPNLTLLIDEVHHAATDDVKLRQVVNRWQAQGNITTVLGFSGTPYLSSPDRIPVTEDAFFRFSQITNTVYYYPLVDGIRTFLKTPRVEIGRNLTNLQIIKAGIEDFQKNFEGHLYKNGCIPKIAIYCPNIATLEEEIFPYLTGTLGISPSEILKYHKGNTSFSQPEGSELEFKSLDKPFSKKKYILLVQIGKEGWDCPSLAGVILSQKGASAKNMVLQTSCRCLRQVDVGKDEKALIWLNDYNAKILNDQLRKEQHTSIEELNRIKKRTEIEEVERFSRMEFLELPLVDFYQLQIKYQSIAEDEKPHTAKKLVALLKNISSFKTDAIISSSEISKLDEGLIRIMNKTGDDTANFNLWLHGICKESFGTIKIGQLFEHTAVLKNIFEQITYEKENQLFWNEFYDTYAINSQIRLAFSIKRILNSESEVIPQTANLLLVDKLTPAPKNKKLYPETEEDTTKIIAFDTSGASLNPDFEELKQKYNTAKELLEAQGMGNMFPPYNEWIKQYEFSLPIRSKDSTFHYLPYNFIQSGFEKDFMTETLRLETFKSLGLEVYYNGERGLTEFVIQCFAKKGKSWRGVGKYTTDFLIIKRKEKKQIHKVLLVETKGEGFRNDPAFQKKKAYVETEFLAQNNNKFGYKRFDFLYLEDSSDTPTNITLLNNRLEAFFID
jgi:type III restriction enzyme